MQRAYIVGTLDTKLTEILYVKKLIENLGVATCVIDVGVYPSAPSDSLGVTHAIRDSRKEFFTGITDRGKALAVMGELLEDFLVSRVDDIGGILGLGGSGNTAVVTRGMRALPVGLPKLMVSTVASGDTSPYVGVSDITMMPSVADVQGLNVITRNILGNAAHALAGMVKFPLPPAPASKPLVGMSMFGVTTPCVQQVCKLMENDWEPLVFHATGTGGRSLEKLVASGMITHVLDITLTEICDLLMGGILSAGEDRMGAVIRTGIPYVGSVGALDMVNFAAMHTVPEKYRQRNLYVHNENVTLMRTTPEENERMGRWIGDKLNQMTGEVRFLLPEGGVSAIDAPQMPFHDPKADAALFEAIEKTVSATRARQVLRLPWHINAPEFSQALVDQYLAINK